MIPRWFSRLRTIRRFLSRGERAATILRLPQTPATAAEPGLVLIQIDGLSRSQFDRALARRRLPFLSRLLRRGDYRVHTFYSGLPSTTPAVQGELFYGVPGAVPAFEFRDRGGPGLTNFLSAETALRIERELEKQGEPLLKHGTAYADIYSGGADDCSFCASRLGWSDLLKNAHPLTLAAIAVMHAFVVVRMVLLSFMELILALFDFALGITERQDLLCEVIFIPKRVGLSILMREMVSLGVRMDVARGVPVIHCNLLGYDEQAHRRGPDSAFAHWTLKGIDATVRGIWRAAARSACRHYDVWVYSDHGQEKAVPYSELHGRGIREAVAEAVERSGLAEDAKEAPSGEAAGPVGSKELRSEGGLLAGGMGTVEHVYLGRSVSPETRARVAAELHRHTRVPVVAVPEGRDQARLWTAAGERLLPEEAALVGLDGLLGQEVARDLVRLIAHPDAGDFVLLGWRPGGKSVTFAEENGAHAGPGEEETRGFLLAPHDADLKERPGGYIRPADLRETALRFLKRKPPAPSSPRRASPRRIRIMTYNVHSCIGMDGRHAPERLARVISRYEPDVVALQELDVNRLRTEGVDQARRIARLLEMEYHFHPSFSVEEEQYGNAVLSVLPMRLVRAAALPEAKGCEPRGAIWVELTCGGRRWSLVNAHLGLRPDERMRQMEALLGRDWIGGAMCRGPVVFCGDLNAVPTSPAYRAAAAALRDTQEARRRRATWMRLICCDYVFAGPEFQVRRTLVPRSHLTGVASDHLPVIADLVLGD